MRKKLLRPYNMAYAHITMNRRGKGSPNSTWTRNGDKSFTNAHKHKRLASLTFVCVIYSSTQESVFFSSWWTSHCLTTFPCSWPKTNPQYKDDNIAFTRNTRIYGLSIYICILEGIPFVSNALTYIYYV